MKRFPLLFLSSFLVIAGTAKADEASKTAKLEEFFRISRTEEMITENLALSMNQAKSELIQQMAALNSSPDQNKILEEWRSKVEKIMSNASSWERVKPAYIKIYSDAYTEGQIDDIVTFYRSPTGQAMVARNPDLMTKASQIVQNRIIAAQPELQVAIKEFVDRTRSTTVPK
jgi:hypothetical protein